MGLYRLSICFVMFSTLSDALLQMNEFSAILYLCLCTTVDCGSAIQKLSAGLAIDHCNHCLL